MFKAGDKVVRVGESHHEVRKGKQYTVVKYIPMKGLLLEGLGDFGYSLDSFKLVKENNMTKQFTKDMLIAGKHVVRYKEDGELGLIVESSQGKYILFYNNSMYASPLEDTDYDQVYAIDTPCGTHDMDSNLTLIWQREEKSEAQIKLEQLEEQQRKLADEIAAVRKSL